VSGAGRRYDEIGVTYSSTRQEDPRVADAIHACFGTARSVVNVGAGSGNYEPADREVVAVEPSQQMIDQRRDRTTRVVRASAERLPFADGAFDLAMAILTIHHWSDPVAGLLEMRRVAQRQVVFFFEPLRTHDFWALHYFPTALELPTETDPPGEALLARHLSVREIRPVLVPKDCRDGFGTAFWARPEAYLEPEVQAGMSWLAMLHEDDRRRGARRLRADIESGEWHRRYGHLLAESTFDGGYRIAVAY
jgi:SAM-dependent methyltransferase